MTSRLFFLSALLFAAVPAHAQQAWRVPVFPSDPFTCVAAGEGFEYWNSTSHVLKVCNGTAWSQGPGFPILAPDGGYTAASYSFTSSAAAGMLYDPAVTASNPGVVLNSPTNGANRLYLTNKFFTLGGGAAASGVTPTDSTIAGMAAASGDSNISGSDIVIAPGDSTGTGFGRVTLYVGLNAASGTSLNGTTPFLDATSSTIVLGNVTTLSGGTAPGASVFAGYNAAGTNVAGGDTNLNSGKGTGSATPSTINFSTPTATASGTTAQTLTTRASVTVEGLATAFHLLATGTAPTVSSCGTGPSITGSDVAGKVTVGTGTITSCTLTFAVAYAAAPACMVNNESTAQLMRAVTTTTTLTIDGADFNTDVVSYLCISGS